MKFQVLGALAVRSDSGFPLSITRRKQRLLLGMLLLRPERPLSIDAIVDGLWPGDVPASATANIQSYVAGLRREFRAHDPDGDRRLECTRGGYVLHVEPDEVDATQFERLVDEARTNMDSGAATTAMTSLNRALSLWRGPVLEGLDVPDHLQPDVVRLEEHRLIALEESMEAALAANEHVRIVAELRALVVAYPLRERLWAQLMLALYRSGLQAGALEVYQQLRSILDEELGIEPGQPLARLWQQILRADPSLAPQQEHAVRGIRPQQPPAVDPTIAVDREVVAALDAAADEACGAGNVGLVAVTGPAGSGKSAAALRWAHDNVERFPDGQLYVALHGFSRTEPLQPLMVLQRLLRGLGADNALVPDSLEEAAATYRSVLAGRRVLIVLDDARDSAHVRDLLPATAGCLALLTSRDRLETLVVHHAVRRVAMAAPAREQSRALLGRLLGAGRVAAEPDAADQLIAQCSGLPLALRIAGAAMADSPHRSIESFVAEFADGLPLAIDSAPGTFDDLAAAQELSYLALSPGAQRLLTQMSQLDIVWSVPAVKAVHNATDGGLDVTAAGLLNELTRIHLVEPVSDGRYRVPQVVRRCVRLLNRDFGGDTAKSEANAPDDVCAGLMSWYAAAAAAALQVLPPDEEAHRLDPPPPAALQIEFRDADSAQTWLQRERRNLALVARHSVQQHPAAAAWVLCEVLPRCAAADHEPDRSRAELRHAWDQAAANGRVPARIAAAVALRLGAKHAGAGHERRALAEFQRAARWAADGGWPEGRMSAMRSIGEVWALRWRAGRVGRNTAEHPSPETWPGRWEFVWT
jgi:DNA-binding SARP family transcriptional activator